MLWCPNCGRRAIRTEDRFCQFCKYPLLSKDTQKIPKIPKKLKAFQHESRNVSVSEKLAQKQINNKLMEAEILLIQATNIADENRNAPISKKLAQEQINNKLKEVEILLIQVANIIEAVGIQTEVKQPPKDTSAVTKLELLPLLYLPAFGGAEFITYYMTTVGGLIFHFVILLSLIVNSTVVQKEAKRSFMIALGLVPLVRIVSLVVPIAGISEIHLYIIIAVPIFIGIITVTRNLNFRPNDIGLNGKKALVQVPVALSGIGLGIVDYLILKPEALTPELSLQALILPAFVLLVTTGFMEELAFRGVIQRAALSTGTWGWIYVAITYTILQSGHRSIFHGVFTFITALFFGWVVKKTESIIGVSLAHGLLNIGMYLILPYVGLNLTLPAFFI